MQVAHGTEPGTNLTITSTSEAMHVTLAYAAAATLMDAFLEWKVGSFVECLHTLMSSI